MSERHQCGHYFANCPECYAGKCAHVNGHCKHCTNKCNCRASEGWLSS